MKYLFACGGTGGHINPAIAIADTVKSKQPDAEIFFIGNKNGMEQGLVAKAGYPFFPIHVSGFQRRISVKNVFKNVSAVIKAVTSTFEASSIIKKINPDVVVGTGGYVSGPVLRKAHKLGYKTATHEQNAFPGITTKMLAKDMDVVMLAMPRAQKYLPNRTYTVTGNPVRRAVLLADKQAARKALGLDLRPMILSFGGSLGAEPINNSVCDLIKSHCDDGKYYHYHGTGKVNYDETMSRLKELGVDLKKYPQIRVSSYIDDMDLCMAAADLVISRSGAITLGEIEAQGKASVLIPSPDVAENHQYHNAMTLVERGASVVIEQKNLSGEKLINEVNAILSDADKRAKMEKAAREGAYLDANERIYKAIMNLIKK